MTISQSSTGTSGPYMGRVSGVTGTPNVRTGTYTIATRVRWSTTATNVDMTLAVLGVQSDGRGLYIQRRNGDASTVVACYRFDGFLTTNVANATGAYGSTTNWVHIGVTYDGSTVRTYVDGVASGTVASTSTTLASGVADFVSCAGGFSGDQADTVMFSRALSAGEMAQLATQRMPAMREGDCFGWWPMIDTSSLSAAGKDYSSTGNDCTLQASGANNPTASQVSVPEAWSGPGPINYTRSITQLATTAAASSVSASGAISETAAITGSGQSSVSASAAISVSTSLTGAGQSSVSASAAIKLAGALTGSGTSSVSASASASEAAALQGTGQSSVSGSGVFASGSLTTQAAASSVSASAAIGESAALTGAGQSASAGSAAITQQQDKAGTGASSVSASGTLSQGFGVVGVGQSSVSASALLTVAYALTGSGQVSVNGAASLATASGPGGRDQGLGRRYLAVLETRRIVRR